MAKGDLIIRPHQVMTCPKCLTYAEFLDHVYSSELPVILKCPHCPWGYNLNDATRVSFHLPKRDSRVPCNAAWTIQREADSPVQGGVQGELDGHAEIVRQIETIPPELRTRSIHERIDEVSAMLLVIKRIEYSIRRDFRTACESFVDDVNSALSPYVHLRGYVDVDDLVDFFERPFLILPLDYAHENIQKFSRLIAAPRFYRKLHGIPIGTGCGFNMQLVCPYSELGEPHPLFLRKLLSLPDPPDIEVLDKKVVGGHIPYFWKDIPGLEADIDHSDNHPSVRMSGDGSKFRQWASQRGIQPWRSMLNKHDAFFETRLDWVSINFPKLKPAMNRLVNSGRVLYAHRSRSARMRMIGAAIQCMQSHTILIHDNGEKINWEEMGVIFGSDVMKHYLVPMAVGDYLRSDYADETELVIAEADKDYSKELLPRLYRHNRRLLLTTGDPLFDALEFNEYAPVVYGLVNSSVYDPESFLEPKLWHKDSPALNEKLIIALRQAGFLAE